MGVSQFCWNICSVVRARGRALDTEGDAVLGLESEGGRGKSARAVNTYSSNTLTEMLQV